MISLYTEEWISGSSYGRYQKNLLRAECTHPCVNLFSSKWQRTISCIISWFSTFVIEYLWLPVNGAECSVEPQTSGTGHLGVHFPLEMRTLRKHETVISNSKVQTKCFHRKRNLGVWWPLNMSLELWPRRSHTPLHVWGADVVLQGFAIDWKY